MKIAAIDVGTNSFHLLVGRVTADGRVEVIERAKEMVRLGDSAFRGGVLSPEAFIKASEALRNFRRIAEGHGCEALIAVATSAVREAPNGGDFVRAMRDETGVDLQVISGEEEARLIYLGARSSLGLNGRRALLCDIGGGSVEIMVCDARELYHQRSLRLGVLRLLGRITTDPISPEEHLRLAEHCHRVLEQVAMPMRRIGFDFVAISAGTARALAELAGATPRGPEGKQRVVRFSDLYALERRLCSMSLAERAKIPGLDPRRYDSIVPGVVLVRSLLEVFHADEYVLCETALREGLIHDYALRNRTGILLADEFPDLRRRSVVALARRTQVLQPHASHVARLALDLFRGLRPLHGLPNSDGEMLEFASILHDIGYYIAASRHHKHGQYLIENMGLGGFSAEEIALLALVVRYHRKSTPKETHVPFGQLPEPLKRRIRLLAAILRVADGLDRTCRQLVRGVRCRIEAREIELCLSARVSSLEELELELWAARRKGDLLQELLGRRLRFSLSAQEDLGEDVDAMTGA
ncbi:MAG: Ppx/GppA phosphatase family protein [Myxococcales bacterium]|nr:Ppx/GppA family phosphatase [Myxococcota bacterium]MDW8282423.1 Ppx/GppA phosphatase family protein [Myxococcales bacterium]